jgi:hypothetical protein
MRTGIPIPATAKRMWKANNIAICARARTSSVIPPSSSRIFHCVVSGRTRYFPHNVTNIIIAVGIGAIFLQFRKELPARHDPDSVDEEPFLPFQRRSADLLASYY